jgi:hypothetical protein
MQHQVTGLTGQIKLPVPQYRMTGRQLAAMLKGKSAGFRAVVDYDLRTGQLVVVGMTAAESRVLTGTPAGYQSTVAGLQPHERRLLMSGQVSISECHNRRKPSVAAVERYCRKAGLDLIWQALERMTKPAPSLVATQ